MVNEMSAPLPERMATVEERLNNVVDRLEVVTSRLEEIEALIQQGKGAKWVIVGVVGTVSGVLVAFFHKLFPSLSSP